MSERASIWVWCAAFVFASFFLLGEADAWRWWHTAAGLTTITAALRITALADRLEEERADRG